MSVYACHLWLNAIIIERHILVAILLLHKQTVIHEPAKPQSVQPPSLPSQSFSSRPDFAYTTNSTLQHFSLFGNHSSVVASSSSGHVVRRGTQSRQANATAVPTSSSSMPSSRKQSAKLLRQQQRRAVPACCRESKIVPSHDHASLASMRPPSSTGLIFDGDGVGCLMWMVLLDGIHSRCGDPTIVIGAGDGDDSTGGEEQGRRKRTIVKRCPICWIRTAYRLKIFSSMRDGTHEPDLAHARDHTRDTETERYYGCDAGGQLVRLVVVLRNVVVDAALEHEVFGERDTLVDGEPVPDEVHEVLQGLFEVAVAGDGDGDVDGRGDAGPDEAGDALGPASQDLHGERDGVDVGAVVGDNGQREDDEAELAEGADVGDENFAEKTAGAGG
nr:hypothetical protein CFP56_03686 [Quercus suber]